MPSYLLFSFSFSYIYHTSIYIIYHTSYIIHCLYYTLSICLQSFYLLSGLHRESPIFNISSLYLLISRALPSLSPAHDRAQYAHSSKSSPQSIAVNNLPLSRLPPALPQDTQTEMSDRRSEKHRDSKSSSSKSTSKSSSKSTSKSSSSSSSSSKTKSQKDDWSEVNEPDERRRIQNRLAQRKFRSSPLSLPPPAFPSP